MKFDDLYKHILSENIEELNKIRKNKAKADEDLGKALSISGDEESQEATKAKEKTKEETKKFGKKLADVSRKKQSEIQ